MSENSFFELSRKMKTAAGAMDYYDRRSPRRLPRILWLPIESLWRRFVLFFGGRR